MRALYCDRENEVIVPYIYGQHWWKIKKFLYWKTPNGEEILLGGCFYVHAELHTFAKSIDKTIPIDPPQGAGNIESGEIENWASSGYQVTTPQEVREVIAQAFGMKYEQ